MFFLRYTRSIWLYCLLNAARGYMRVTRVLISSTGESAQVQEETNNGVQHGLL